MQWRPRPAVNVTALPGWVALCRMLAIVISLAQRHKVGLFECYAWVIRKLELVMHMGAIGRHAMSQQYLAPELAPGPRPVEWIMGHGRGINTLTLAASRVSTSIPGGPMIYVGRASGKRMPNTLVAWRVWHSRTSCSTDFLFKRTLPPHREAPLVSVRSSEAARLMKRGCHRLAPGRPT